MLLFNQTLELLSETFTQDDLNQAISTPVYKKVYAKKKSIPQSEFFNAGQTDIKPSACFIIRQCEYNGESKLRFPCGNDGKIYKIYRTYDIKNEMCELYCEVRSGA